MTTEELAELFLAHLYDLAEAAPHPNFLFSVNDFAQTCGVTDRRDLEKAMNYLGDRGLVILAGIDMLGGISAGITIDGSVFVEKGGETGIIGQYRRDPRAFAVTPSELQPSSPAAEEKATRVHEEKQAPFYAGRAVAAILSDIEDVLQGEESVATETKKDLLADLATIKIQMARSVKNKAVIEAVLDDLSGIPSIAPLVTALNCIVGAYFK
jgi:hypothetical protein